MNLKTKLMKTKDINTLSQLRQAKAELKLKMKQADKSMNENIIYAGLNKLFAGNKKKTNYDPAVMDEGTENSIRFLASQTSHRSGVWRYLKPALSLAITIAAPILAKKAGDLINKKS